MSTVVRVAITASIALTFFLAPASAPARIVPGGGIAGVGVGEKMNHVRERLGRPRKVRPPAWVYGRPLRGEIQFDHRRRVKSIWTSSPRQRTRRGIGPGSSLPAARRAYPRLRCYSKRRFRRCTFRRLRNRKLIATDFLFKGRLRIINIHLLPKPSGTPIPK